MNFFKCLVQQSSRARCCLIATVRTNALACMRGSRIGWSPQLLDALRFAVGCMLLFMKLASASAGVPGLAAWARSASTACRAATRESRAESCNSMTNQCTLSTELQITAVASHGCTYNTFPNLRRDKGYIPLQVSIAPEVTCLESGSSRGLQASCCEAWRRERAGSSSTSARATSREGAVPIALDRATCTSLSVDLWKLYVMHDVGTPKGHFAPPDGHCVNCLKICHSMGPRVKAHKR